MLKVFGIEASRTARTLWLCRELGVPHEHVPVNYADPATHTPEFLAASPGGKIPAIDDDGFHLTESMAINFYLARKHASPLLPGDMRLEAQILQWSFWVMTEVEKPLLAVLQQRMPPLPDPVAEQRFRQRVPRSAAAEQAGLDAVQEPFALLNAHLATRDHLLGADFTLADFNVACILVWAERARMDLSALPHLRRWLDRCLSRPGAIRRR